MDSRSIPQPWGDSIDSRLSNDPARHVILLGKGLAAFISIVIPATAGYLHARNGLPPRPSPELVPILGITAGSMIEILRGVENFTSGKVISEEVLRGGYEIFRWPVGVTAVYLGIYKAAYCVGSLDRS